MQTLSTYANEMQIPVCNTDDPVDVDAVVSEFALNSTAQVKRIVLVELLALAFADGDYSSEEKGLVQQIANAFNFNDSLVEHVVDLEKSYMATCVSLVNFVNKE